MGTTTSHTPQQTAELGRQLGQSLQRGAVIALCGDLGAGKTAFTQGLAEGLGIETRITSPTFTLLHEHPGGRLPLYHADLYRLESEAEARDIGLEEVLEGDGVAVVEWADKFPALLPPGTLWVRIAIGEGDTREITL